MSILGRLIGFLNRSDGSLQHRAMRSGVWVGVSGAFVAVLTFVRGIVLARLLTPDVFGMMAVSLMATRLIEIFTETGFGQALIHRQERFEDARDTAFTLMVIRGIGLALLSLAVAPWVAWFYQQPVLQSVVAVVGLSFLFTGFQNINTVALQKDLDFKRLTLLEMTGAVASFIATVALAYWLRSVWALVYGQIATAAINSVLSFAIVRGHVRFRLDFGVAKQLYGYGRFITGLAVVVFITREVDSAMIGRLLGMEALGYYVTAYSLANIPSTYLSKLVAKVLFPFFSRLQSDVVALRAEYSRGIRLVTSIAVPISVATAILAPQIIQALYGSRWAAAAAPLRVLAVFGCFRAMWMLNGYLYNAIGRPQIDFYMNLGRLVVMVPLLFPLTLRYGVVGAATAVTLPMVLQFCVGVYLSRRYIGVPATTALGPLAIAIWQSIVLGVILLLARSVVSAGPRLNLVVFMGVSAVVWSAFNLRGMRAALSARRLS